LTKFDISKNDLKAEGGMALAAGLKGNQVITELNTSDNTLGWNSEGYIDTSGIIAIADAIPDMGALSKLVMRQNNVHGAEAGKAFADMLAQNTVVKELDLSSQKVGTYGDALDATFVKEFAAGISDNGTISIVNLAKNEIQFSNELCETLLRCAIDSGCGLRIQIAENEFSATNKHTMEFILLELLGKEDIPTEVNVESAGLTGIAIDQ
jgi:hypothetical protein